MNKLININNYNELIHFIIFLITFIFLYFSFTKNLNFKRIYTILVIFYFSIFDIKYALIVLIIYSFDYDYSINENFSFFDKKQRGKLKNLVTKDSLNSHTNKMKNWISSKKNQIQSNFSDEENELGGFLKKNKNHQCISKCNRNCRISCESQENFINFNDITGSLKRGAEIIHNNNSIDKITKNLKNSAKRIIKRINEEEENEKIKLEEEEEEEELDEEIENFTNRKSKNKNKRTKSKNRNLMELLDETNNHKQIIDDHQNSIDEKMKKINQLLNKMNSGYKINDNA